jgi:hypothetical protein
LLKPSRKLLELTGGSPAISKDPLPMHLSQGSIYLKDQPFSLDTFLAWQLTAWRNSLNAFKPNVPASLSPTEATLKLLSTEHWTAPKALEPALKIYCFGGKIPPAEKLLKAGWELGLLSRLEIGSVPHYRLTFASDPIAADTPYPAALKWADTASKPGSVKIDLRLIPLHDLDLLNTLTHLDLEYGKLHAFPSLIKLGRAAPASPLMKPLLKGYLLPNLLFVDSEHLETLHQHLDWLGWNVSDQLQLIPHGHVNRV